MTYPIQSILSEIPLDYDPETPLHICAYTVTATSYLPFLQYFLYKSASDQVLRFPSTTYKKAHAVVGEIFKAFGKSDLSLHVCNGIFVDKYTGEKYIFYDCSAYDIQPHTLTEHSDVWLTTMYEIINTCHVHNREVAQKTTGFFLNNPLFIHLADAIETPMVMYLNDLPKSKVDFVLTFGPSSINNFYEFYSCNDENFPSIRFAIFADKALFKTTEETEAKVYIKDYDHFVSLTALY